MKRKRKKKRDTEKGKAKEKSKESQKEADEKEEKDEDKAKDKEEEKEMDERLFSAYKTTCEVAMQNNITSLCFSLISAGIFKGKKSLSHVLEIGIRAILETAASPLTEVHLCGFKSDEIYELENILAIYELENILAKKN